MPTINSIRKSRLFAVETKVSKLRKTWSFHVVVWHRTATKCTKTYNARAQLLFVSLNLLFGDVPVAVAVVLYLSSLLCLLCFYSSVSSTYNLCPSLNFIHVCSSYYTVYTYSVIGAPFLPPPLPPPPFYLLPFPLLL